MSIIELAVIVTIIMIIAQIKIGLIEPPNQKQQMTLKQIQILIQNMQTIAKNYHHSMQICGIKANLNSTLHNCSKDQHDWSNGILAYIDYTKSGRYQDNIANEKIALLNFAKSDTQVINNGGMEWTIDSTGRLKTSYSLNITSYNIRLSVLINTSGEMSDV